MGIGNLGLSELLIVAVLVLLLFGPRRLPEIARTVGQALRRFKRGMNEVKRELDEMERTSGPDRTDRTDDREAPRGELRPPGSTPEAGDEPGERDGPRPGEGEER